MPSYDHPYSYRGGGGGAPTSPPSAELSTTASATTRGERGAWRWVAAVNPAAATLVDPQLLTPNHSWSMMPPLVAESSALTQALTGRAAVQRQLTTSQQLGLAVGSPISPPPLQAQRSAPVIGTHTVLPSYTDPPEPLSPSPSPEASKLVSTAAFVAPRVQRTGKGGLQGPLDTGAVGALISLVHANQQVRLSPMPGGGADDFRSRSVGARGAVHAVPLRSARSPPRQDGPTAHQLQFGIPFASDIRLR
jgi:hypothetical protein